MASIRDHRVNDNMDPFLFQVIVWKRISSILVRNNLWETLVESWKRINVRGSTCPSSQNKSLISQIILMKTFFRLQLEYQSPGENDIGSHFSQKNQKRYRNKVSKLEKSSLRLNLKKLEECLTSSITWQIQISKKVKGQSKQLHPNLVPDSIFLTLWTCSTSLVQNDQVNLINAQ